MYGIGYSHSNFWGGGKTGDWGLYVAANGTIHATIGQSNPKIWTSGYGQSDSSWRAPIFYDSNDTSYYDDPNGDSRTNATYLNRWRIYSSTGDLVNDAPWYGYGLSNIGGSIGFYLGQLAHHHGLRLRAHASVLDIDGSAFGSSWIWGNTNFAVAGQNRGTIFYDYNDTTYYCDPNSTSNMVALTLNSTFRVNNGWSYVANNYGYGVVGLYDSTIYQLVFAMGDSYKTTAGGGINNLYGIAWSHPNAGGIAGNLDSHGLIVAINGGFGSCMAYSIKASSNVTAYSDERLKKDWSDLPKNYVEELAKVKVGTYTRIDGEKLRQVGVSAQSLRPLLPEAVIEATDDFKTLSVAYGNAAMASAVELAKEVVSLKEQLAAVLDRLNKLENK
jgi:hypothetical protein